MLLLVLVTDGTEIARSLWPEAASVAIDTQANSNRPKQLLWNGYAMAEPRPNNNVRILSKRKSTVVVS